VVGLDRVGQVEEGVIRGGGGGRGHGGRIGRATGEEGRRRGVARALGQVGDERPDVWPRKQLARCLILTLNCTSKKKKIVLSLPAKQTKNLISLDIKFANEP
jgi:hypothetical protein